MVPSNRLATFHRTTNTHGSRLPDGKLVLRARFGVLEMKYSNTPAPLHEPVCARRTPAALSHLCISLARSGRSRSDPSFQEFCLGFPVLFHRSFFFVYISNTRPARWWHISCIPLPSVYTLLTFIPFRVIMLFGALRTLSHVGSQRIFPF